MYLRLTDEGSNIYKHLDVQADWATHIPVDSTGAELLRQWYGSVATEVGFISGLLADWLDENRSHLLTTVDDTAAERRLDRFIGVVRREFLRQFELST